MTTTSLQPCPPRRSVERSDTPEAIAERHLLRRIVVGTAIAMPVGALVFALLVGIAMAIAGEPVLVPAAMGAGVGLLAGSFFGMWAGIVASVRELDRLDVRRGPEALDEAASRL